MINIENITTGEIPYEIWSMSSKPLHHWENKRMTKKVFPRKFLKKIAVGMLRVNFVFPNLTLF